MWSWLPDNTGYSLKGKVHPRTGHQDTEENRSYNFTLSLTSALDGDGWSTPRPGRLTPVKETRYPFCRKLGGPQGWSGRVRKISPPPGFDRRTFHPVASRYTECAIPAHTGYHYPLYLEHVRLITWEHNFIMLSLESGNPSYSLSIIRRNCRPNYLVTQIFIIYYLYNL
jgi:hypothetical protein